jgi:hypothetical protein
MSAWEVRAYRTSPLQYSGTDKRSFKSERDAARFAEHCRRNPDFFCVEVRKVQEAPPETPPYFWLGADAGAM